MKDEMTQVAVRMPKRLRSIVRRFIELHAHKDEAEFYRDAIREKIQRDAPSLYGKLPEKKTAGTPK